MTKSCGQCGLIEPHVSEGFEGDSYDSIAPHRWDGETLEIIEFSAAVAEIERAEAATEVALAEAEAMDFAAMAERALVTVDHPGEVALTRSAMDFSIRETLGEGWRLTKMTEGWKATAPDKMLVIELEYHDGSGMFVRAELQVDTFQNLLDMGPFLKAAETMRPGARLKIARDSRSKASQMYHDQGHAQSKPYRVMGSD